MKRIHRHDRDVPPATPPHGHSGMRQRVFAAAAPLRAIGRHDDDPAQPVVCRGLRSRDRWYRGCRALRPYRLQRVRPVLAHPVRAGQRDVRRCVHRRSPLSQSPSRRVGDTVVCGYHGFTYRADGGCVAVRVVPGGRPPTSTRTGLNSSKANTSGVDLARGNADGHGRVARNGRRTARAGDDPLPSVTVPSRSVPGGTVHAQLDRGPATWGAPEQVPEHAAEAGRADVAESQERGRAHRTTRRARTSRAISAIRRSEHGAATCGVPVPGRPHAEQRPRASGTWSRRSAATTAGMSARAAASGSVGSRTGLVPLCRVGIKALGRCVRTGRGPPSWGRLLPHGTAKSDR